MQAITIYYLRSENNTTPLIKIFTEEVFFKTNAADLKTNSIHEDYLYKHPSGMFGTAPKLYFKKCGMANFWEKWANFIK